MPILTFIQNEGTVQPDFKLHLTSTVITTVCYTGKKLTYQTAEQTRDLRTHIYVMN